MEKHPWNSEQAVSEFIGSLIKLHSAKKVLEIGVFEGQTGIEMIKAVGDDGHYVGIDITDENFNKTFKKLITPLNDSVAECCVHIGSSFDILPTLEPKSFDLIFIDSVHEYDHLKKEFKLCEKLIKQNGLIVLHDAILFEGVNRFCNELKSNKGFEVLILETPKEGDREPSGLAVIKTMYA
jgi:predicted O-methyltransferase YrrM